jgi:hypothetical protein
MQTSFGRKQHATGRGRLFKFRGQASICWAKKQASDNTIARSSTFKLSPQGALWWGLLFGEARHPTSSPKATVLSVTRVTQLGEGTCTFESRWLAKFALFLANPPRRQECTVPSWKIVLTNLGKGTNGMRRLPACLNPNSGRYNVRQRNMSPPSQQCCQLTKSSPQ